MAGAAKITVAVEEQPDHSDPNQIHIPGIFVRVFQEKYMEKESNNVP
jgi:acyl CoA:acetate/3-ketoacid CoA transferase alpha subunit